MLVISCTSSTKKMYKGSGAYEPFGVVYSDINPLTVSGYKTLIVEPYFFNKKDISELHSRGLKVIAYISLGEVNPSRKYFEEFKKIGFKGKNGNFGSYYNNLSDSRIKEKFLHEIVPELLSNGYDGLFLDTIDAVAPYTDRREMESDMVDLIKSIKISNPDKLLIQNAGLFLLDETSEFIDAIAIEDIASGYNFDTNKYQIKSKEEFEERLNLVDTMYNRYKIPFLIIDFAEEERTEVIVRSRLEKTGHSFFISNIEFKGLPKLRSVYSKIKKGA